ncbi:PPC domain-containing protein [Nodosilinea sp. LEGE 07088]|uniref:PPC domain-containing protein n=1 Tax=Nodosilinea sp. LEGE 07088 TaxID=2777968 RepID=UPI0018821C1D|nr:PPC domain-containing protein [Nodosilinea sp. LEGE 07088]MBE9140203.1 PPC domain-containing protein [Nodosilinea sp. LEGE 07088]
MKLLTTVGLSFVTLLVSVAAPFTIRHLPHSAPSVGIMQAIASTPLLQVQDRLGPEKEVIEFDEGNRFVAFYDFDGNAGQAVSLTLDSDDFDTILMVFDSNSERLALNDDISEGNTNSRIDITLPATDKYTVLVTSYEFEAQGNYRLAAVSP